MIKVLDDDIVNNEAASAAILKTKRPVRKLIGRQRQRFFFAETIHEVF